MSVQAAVLAHLHLVVQNVFQELLGGWYHSARSQRSRRNPSCRGLINFSDPENLEPGGHVDHENLGLIVQRIDPFRVLFHPALEALGYVGSLLVPAFLESVLSFEIGP